MVASKSTALYKSVVDITYDYLGPAADRFITRQIRSHLNKTPEQLKKDDLKELIDWIKVAMSLLTDDEKLLKQYLADLKQLTH